MPFISGYKFDTKKIADDAMTYLNTHHGLPVNGGLTKFDETSYNEHPNGYYYIINDTEWTSPLGEPIDIELTEQPLIK
jgi:hypothetical protein